MEVFASKPNKKGLNFHVISEILALHGSFCFQAKRKRAKLPCYPEILGFTWKFLLPSQTKKG